MGGRYQSGKLAGDILGNEPKALFGWERKVEGKKVRGKNIEGMKVSRKWMESGMIVKLFGLSESE
jgi:acetyl-CoA carboxylase beta subunit